VVDGALRVRDRLGRAEPAQDARAILRRRRLGEPPPQVRERGVGGAAGERELGGLDQRAGYPGVRGRLGEEQVGGDHVDIAAFLREHSRGPAVIERALGGRDLLVDGLSHHRVNELERAAPGKDCRRREPVGRLGRGGWIEPREQGRVVKIGPLEEDRGRPGEGAGPLTQPRDS
jgi:hypothetical protein